MTTAPPGPPAARQRVNNPWRWLAAGTTALLFLLAAGTALVWWALTQERGGA